MLPLVQSTRAAGLTGGRADGWHLANVVLAAVVHVYNQALALLLLTVLISHFGSAAAVVSAQAQFCMMHSAQFGRGTDGALLLVSIVLIGSGYSSSCAVSR